MESGDGDSKSEEEWNILGEEKDDGGGSVSIRELGTESQLVPETHPESHQDLQQRTCGLLMQTPTSEDYGDSAVTSRASPSRQTPTSQSASTPKGERAFSRASRGASRASHRGSSRLSGGGSPYKFSKPLSDEQQQQLMRRVWKMDELIKQLKQIVKAQHVKIEELRDKLEHASTPNYHLQMVIAERGLKDIALVQEENEEHRRKMMSFKAEAMKYKAEADNLKKVNRRLKAMLEHDNILPMDESMLLGTRSVAAAPDALPRIAVCGGGAAPKTGTASAGAAGALTEHSMLFTQDSTMSGSEASLRMSTAPPSARIATIPSGAPDTPRQGSRGVGRREGQGHETKSATLPSFSRLSRLHNVVPMFLQRPHGKSSDVLTTLVEMARRLVSDKAGVVITMYMLDPQLCQEAQAQSMAPPVLYYLNQGKTQLQVLHQESVRPQPPCFADLHELPTRTRTAIAVALQKPGTNQKMAVLQAYNPEAASRSAGGAVVAMPKALRNIIGEVPDNAPKAVAQGLTDSHLMCLQMVCQIASGLLEQIEQISEREVVLDRMRGCVDVAGAVNKARSILDFEQRVKNQLGMFFNVNFVRILFYNRDTSKLEESSPQTAHNRHKERSGTTLEKGIVGLTARRKQVVHIPDCSLHPYVDPDVDGLRAKGVNPQAEMLCGPMVVDYDEGGQLVGVVQLLERARAKTSVGTAKGATAESNKEFSMEDQALFQQILRVCAHCAWRTLKVEEFAAEVEEHASLRRGGASKSLGPAAVAAG